VGLSTSAEKQRSLAVLNRVLGSMPDDSFNSRKATNMAVAAQQKASSGRGAHSSKSGKPSGKGGKTLGKRKK